jgi:hypothetical protein
MVVVVPDAILEASRRSGGLNAPDQSLGNEHPESVVHGLQRDGTDRGPDGLGHGISRDVWLSRHRPKDGQTLSSNLDSVFSKTLGGIHGHMLSNFVVIPILDRVWTHRLSRRPCQRACSRLARLSTVSSAIWTLFGFSCATSARTSFASSRSASHRPYGNPRTGSRRDSGSDAAPATWNNSMRMLPR